MRILHCAFTSLMLVAGSSAPAAAQAPPSVRAPVMPPTPPRDRLAPPTTGRGAIKGRVIDGTTGRGLPRVRVRLAGVPGVEPPQAFTDESGAFAFANLPPGRFMVSASRSGFLNADQGQRRTVRTMSRGYELADGQTRDDVVLTLQRGGVIAGRVVDAHGEPVENARVSLFRVPRPGASGRPMQMGGGTTNDIGEFRVARLEQGSYLLAVTAATDGPGHEEIQFAPSYFPGVDSIDQAQALTVERGQVTGGVDITLREVSATLVTGSVVDAQGAPVGGGFIQVMRYLDDRRSWPQSGSSVRQDGTFRLRLAPGDYRLEAQAPRSGLSVPSRANLRGSVRVSVAGEAIGGLAIQLGAGATLSGRFVFEGTTPPPAGAGQLGVNVSPPPASDDCQSRGEFEIKPDFTFSLTDVSGTCVVRSWAGGRWQLKSITHEGTSIADRPVELKPGQHLRGVQIVYTDQRTELTFDVSDTRGVTTLEYVAIVFPADREKWSPEPMGSIRIHTPPQISSSPGLAPGRAAALTVAGSSSVPGTSAPRRANVMSGLPPAEYLAVAVDDVAVEDLQEPSVLEALAERAVRFRLADGESRTLQLPRIRAPQPVQP